MSRFFRKPPIEQEVAGEVSFHLEMRVRELMAQGLSESAARAEALARFGDVEAIRGTLHRLGRERDATINRRQWLADAAQDARAALRQLRRAPVFALASLATLALGNGASTTVFSVANAVLFRPFPFRDPATLLRVWENNPNAPQFAVSEPNFLDFAARNRTYEGMAAWTARSATLIGDGDPERLVSLAATPSFFRLLGIAPLAGRTFTEEEGAAGSQARVALISRRLWQRRFGGDPAITTRSLNLDGVSYQVAGVVTEDLDVFGLVDLWLPLAPSPARSRSDDRLGVMARLKPGVTAEQGTQDLQRVARELSAEYPASNKDWGVTTLGIQDWIVGPQLRGRLRVLLGGVALLLVMACVNVANLLMARATSRRRELTVRAALGAGRWRIARQLLAESLVLAFLGAGLGIGFAFAAVPLLRDVAADSVPRLAAMTVDLRVLLFGVAAALITGLLFGTAPALSASRVELTGALRSGARTIGRHLRPALIGGSVALAMILLSGAALIGGSFLRLTREELGFDAEGVLTASLALPASRYPNGEARSRLVNDLVQRLEALPGVEGAAVVNVAPFSGGNTAFQILPAPAPEGTQPIQVSWRSVSPGYFGTLGIRLLSGRLLDGRDRPGAPPVVVISESMARRVWPGQPAVGRRILDIGSGSADEIEVVGVVSDTRDIALDEAPAERIYLAYAQAAWSTPFLVVRGAGSPDALLAAVRAEVRAADPLLPLQNPRPLADMVADSTAEPRLTTLIFALFAAAALVLAIVGLYGLVAYGVSQRTREFGVRLALGARPSRIVGAVLREGVSLALLGVVTGVAAALALSRFLGAILYGIEPTNAPSYLLMALLLLFCASVATLIPARRAARLQPTDALRDE